MLTVEPRCSQLDRSCSKRRGAAAIVTHAPRPILEALELAYTTCFLVIPAGALVAMAGGAPRAADRFWTLVLAGEFGAFAMMPWIQTRPPWAIEAPGPIDGRSLAMRRLNRLFVRHATIQVNTLPSGHVSGSLATAIAVWTAVPAAGPAFLALAGFITIATVVGRYHYLVDAITGVGMALGAWAFTRAVGL